MLEKVQEDRANKLQAIRDLGIDPYGRRYDTARPIADLLKQYEQWEAAQGGAEKVKAAQTGQAGAAGQVGEAVQKLRGDAAGRIILLRDMGKMLFAHIRDESHPAGMQIALRKTRSTAVPAVSSMAVPAMSSTGILPVEEVPILKRKGAKLPHWTQAGATYSVTFRLADSLPSHVVEGWQRERQDIEQRAKSQGRDLTSIERKELQHLYSARVDSILNAGRGECHLKDPAVAALVQDALKHFHGQRYELIAWAIMPNHVHVVVRPLGDCALSDILHSWKSFTSKQANKLLGRAGQFWQEEYYDHLIRDEEDFNNAVNYVLSNPDRAALENWPWVGLQRRQGQDAPGTHGRDAHATHGQDARATAAGALDEQSFNLAKLLDLGDIVAVEGPMERTRTGEITIWAERLVLLTKSLNPMPEKWHGLSDVQTRYRQRYLDLMTNPDSTEVFRKRVEIIQTFRDLLRARKFVEVETPTLQSIYGGAAARPFVTHHNTLDIDLFMRISPELYLKRLLVGGMEKVYEFARVFRNEGIDTRHNPEFTLMELYQAYADYEVMMDITEELVSEAATRLVPELLKRVERFRLEADKYEKLRQEFVSAGNLDIQVMDDSRRAHFTAEQRCGSGGTALPYGGRAIDYTRPWPRKKYRDLVLEHAGVDWKDDAAVRAKARELKIEESNKDLAVVVNALFETTVEPAMAKANHPTFVMDYPAEICPLTRRKADDPSVALRFECFVAGMEIANAYTELNDPAVQEENFRQQVRGEAANETMRVMDEDFVTALRHGMPPAGGLGIGIDRVIMLLTNTQSIRDVVLFPLLRPE